MENYFLKVETESRNDFEIVEYDELLKLWITELQNTDATKAMKFGYQILDSKLGYIMPWQLLIIWWVTWTGKSTFSNDIAKNIAKNWVKVWKFTLEDRQEDIMKKELYYTINRLRKQKGLKAYPLSEFIVNNIHNQLIKQEIQEAEALLIKENKGILNIVKKDDKQLDLTNLEKLIKQLVEKGCKFILLDHLQEFKVEWEKDRHDLKIEEMMYKIKSIARNYWVAIMLVAHYHKLGKEAKPNDESFKDSIAITQVANKVIHLYRNKLELDGITEVIITKNRDTWWTWILELNFDVNTYTYTNVKNENNINHF